MTLVLTVYLYMHGHLHYQCNSLGVPPVSFWILEKCTGKLNMISSLWYACVKVDHSSYKNGMPFTFK